ncbi:DUF1330 domain-containing protein [Prosthecobacter sp.]|jgi:hypothetical protein|uniref:DUF1330 domain-containing protein n=1 Tax=Prosthecobacter sp. TaxID=1965333 RepID=UPI0037CA9F39
MSPVPASPRCLMPTQQAGREFAMRGMQGELIMLNLLRFRETADYSSAPELAPDSPIRGAEAFDRYIRHTLPFLHQSGGELMFLGAGGSFLIGPEHERWDLVMLVRQSSAEAFLAFAENQDCMAGLGHRTAAVQDSRLLPLSQISSFDGGIN